MAVSPLQFWQSQARPRCRRLRAKAVLERQQWLKVHRVSISGNYPESAMQLPILIHTWALLAVGWSAGAELTNENNCKK